MAGTAHKNSVTSFHASKVKPSAFDAAEFVVRPKVIEKQVKLQVLATRAQLASVATKHQSLRSDASCLKCPVTRHHAILSGSGMRLADEDDVGTRRPGHSECSRQVGKGKLTRILSKKLERRHARCRVHLSVRPTDDARLVVKISLAASERCER